MTNRLFTACMTAWSEAFARALAQCNPRLSSFRQRRGGVVRALKPASLLLAAAILLGFLAAEAASSPTAEAQNATITSLLSRLDVEVSGSLTLGYYAGYDAEDSQGSLSPAGFNYPAGFGAWYRVDRFGSIQESDPGGLFSTGLVLWVSGTVTSVEGSGDHRARVLPAGADITLHLEVDDFTGSYSLKSPKKREVTKCSDENGTKRHCRVGETAREEYLWNNDLDPMPEFPPALADGDTVLVRLRYSAPRPGTPGTPTVAVPTGKSGALIVNWAAPLSNNPAVLGYHVHVTKPKPR